MGFVTRASKSGELMENRLIPLLRITYFNAPSASAPAGLAGFHDPSSAFVLTSVQNFRNFP